MGYDGPKYTQTPNLFLDEHLPEMGAAETKVVLAVIRQTFGWHKQKDRLSISQLMELTGLSNRAVIDGTRQAMERGVIDRQKKGNSYEYWLVVDGEDTSQARDQGVNNAHTPCEDTSQEGVNEAHTQKKGKETTQKKSPRAREDDPPGVKVWTDVTGQRPSIGTREQLKKAFSREGGPRWDRVAFQETLREAQQNVNGDADRIRVGYLMSSYKKRLARSGDGAPVHNSSKDGKELARSCR